MVFHSQIIFLFNFILNIMCFENIYFSENIFIYIVISMYNITYKLKIFQLYFKFFRFGYATNTKIKFIIVLQSSNATLRDNEVRMVRA